MQHQERKLPLNNQNTSQLISTNLIPGIEFERVTKTNTIQNKPVDEKAYFEEHLNFIKEGYHSRLESLLNEISKIRNDIENDEIITAMKDDPVSNEFIGLRIKEIINEALLSEREALVAKLIEEGGFLKGELAKVTEETNMYNETNEKKIELVVKDMKKNFEKEKENDIHQIISLQNENKELNQKYEEVIKQNEIYIKEYQDRVSTELTRIINENKESKEKNTNLINELQFEKTKNNELQASYEKILKEWESNSSKSDLMNQQKITLIHQLEENEMKLNAMNTLNIECANRFKKMEEVLLKKEEQLRIIDQEKMQLIDKFTKYGEDMKNSNKEAINSVMNKYKEKIDKLRKNCNNKTAKLTSLEEEILMQKKLNTDIRDNYEKTINKLHEDVLKIKQEWEKKYEQLELDNKKKIDDQEIKSSLDYKNFHSEYQELLDVKANEIQQEYNKKLQEKIDEMEKMKEDYEYKIQEITSNYTPNSECQNIIESERKKMINEFVMEKEKLQADLEKAWQSKIEKEKNEYEKKISIMQKKYTESLSNYEKQKRNLKKQSKEVSMIESESLKIIEDYKILKEDNEKLAQMIKDMNENESKLSQEKDHILKNLNDQLSQITKLQDLNKALTDELQSSKITYEKLREQMEFQNHDLNKNEKKIFNDSNSLKLKVSSLQDENSKLKNEIQKTLEMSESLKKYENLYEQEHKTNTETIKKIEELENLLLEEKRQKEEIEEKLSESNEIANKLIKFSKDTEKMTKMYDMKMNEMKKELIQAFQFKETILRSTKDTLKGLRLAFSKYISKFKKEFNVMKIEIQKEISTLKNYHLKMGEQIAIKIKENYINLKFVYDEKLNKEKASIINEMLDKIERKEKDEFNLSSKLSIHFEEVIKDKDNKIQNLEKTIDAKRKEELNLKKEISNLNIELNKVVNLNKELDNSYNQVKLEISNLKLKNANVIQMNSSIKSKEEKLKNENRNTLMEINLIKDNISNFQIESLNQLRNLFDDLGLIERSQKEEKNDIIKDTENKLNEAFNSIEIHKQKIEELVKEVTDMEQKNMVLQEENKVLQENFNQINKDLSTENTKLKKEFENINQKNNKISQKEIDQYQKELEFKNTSINKLNNNLHSLNEEYKSLKNNYDQELTKKSLEYTKIISKKEKEISELHQLLSKSYKALNVSIDRFNSGNSASLKSFNLPGNKTEIIGVIPGEIRKNKNTLPRKNEDREILEIAKNTSFEI